MKTRLRIVPSLIVVFFVSGCVSTTTGSITEPVRDEGNAAELNYQLGARYYNQGSLELARDRLLLATEMNPKLALAYSMLGMTYEALDIPRLAKQAYESSIRVGARNFDVQNAYAVFLCRQKDYVGAAKHFDIAINHPENDNAQITMTNAGTCMTGKPDFEAAEGYFRAALERKPGFGDALIQLCLLKYQEQDYLGARAFLQRYMSTNVTTASVLYLAARIEGLLGNDRGKTEYENQLIRQFPASPEAKKVLGAG